MSVEPSESDASSAQTAFTSHLSKTQRFKLGGLLELRAEFQRPLDGGRVSKIVREWDPDVWDMPVVNVHPDTMEITLVEGMHRVAAAVRVLGPDAMVECRITNVREPALLFVAINTAKRRVSALDVFRALVDAGDVTAMSITALAAKYNFKIAHGSEARTIGAARVLQSLYEMDELALSKALETASALITRHNNERGWVNAGMLNALTWFYRLTDVQPKELIPRLDKYSPYAVVTHAVYDMLNVVDIAAIHNKGRHERNHVDPTKSSLWKLSTGKR